MGRLIYTPGPDIKFRTGVIGKVTDEPEKTVSGAIASFDDGADNKPLRALSVGIEPVQAGTGDPSPENVRPISGWSEANIWNDPKYGGNIVWNQLIKWQTTRTNRGVTLTQNSDGSLTLTGANNSDSNQYFDGITNDLPTGHVYLIGNPDTDNSGGGGASGTYNLFLRYKSASTSFAKVYKNATPLIIKPNAGTHSYWNIRIQYGNSSAGVTFNDTFFPYCFDLTMMFGEEIADQFLAMETAEPGTGVAWFRNLFPKEWYPYNAGESTCVSAVNEDPYQQVTVGLGEERYGGTLDVITGQMTVTWVKVVFDGSDSGKVTYKYPNKYCFNITTDLPQGALVKTPNNNSTIGLISDMLTNLTDNVLYNGNNTGIATSTNGNFSKMGLAFLEPESVAAANAWLAEHPITVIAPLAEPQTVFLTPQQINSLLGENHIWADTGDVTVTYPVSVRIPVIIRGVNDQEGEEADENDQ